MSCVYAWVTQKTVLNVVKIRPSDADSHSAGQEIFAGKKASLLILPAIRHWNLF
jgi:hypothetical protein